MNPTEVNPIALLANVVGRRDTIHSVLHLIEELQVSTNMARAQLEALTALPSVAELRRAHPPLSSSEEQVQQQLLLAESKLQSMVAWSAEARKEAKEKKKEKKEKKGKKDKEKKEKKEKKDSKEQAVEKEADKKAMSIAGRLMYPKEEELNLQIRMQALSLAVAQLNTAITAATLAGIAKTSPTLVKTQ